MLELNLLDFILTCIKIIFRILMLMILTTVIVGGFWYIFGRFMCLLESIHLYCKHKGRYRWGYDGPKIIKEIIVKLKTNGDIQIKTQNSLETKIFINKLNQI